MSLTPDQARALWEAGGFAVLEGLPSGSEVGMDGVYHAIASFSGYKFLPPGLHALVWAPAPSSSSPSAVPLRTALIHSWAPKERVAIALDGDEVKLRKGKEVEEAELRALDPRMAPYPFNALEGWKALSGHIGADVVQRVLQGQFVDSLTPVEGEVDDVEAARQKIGEGEEREESKEVKEKGKARDESALVKHGHGEHHIHLPVFDLRRSWPAGATGDEVTRWSQDKSKVWERVCHDLGGPESLLGHLALSYLLVTVVWNYPSLSSYKRLVSLLCRSHSALAEPEAHGCPPSTRELTLAFVDLLTTQISHLPTEDMADLDTFYSEEIEALRRGLGAALAVRGWWGLAGRAQAAWTRLQKAAGQRGWAAGELAQGDEDEDEEEGEYAPVVVEM